MGPLVLLHLCFINVVSTYLICSFNVADIQSLPPKEHHVWVSSGRAEGPGRMADHHWRRSPWAQSVSVTLADAKGLSDTRLYKFIHTLLRTKSLPRTELNALPYRSDKVGLQWQTIIYVKNLGCSSINFSSHLLGLWWFCNKNGLGAALGRLRPTTTLLSLQPSPRMHAQLATPLTDDTLIAEPVAFNLGVGSKISKLWTFFPSRN